MCVHVLCVCLCVDLVPDFVSKLSDCIGVCGVLGVQQRGQNSPGGPEHSPGGPEHSPGGPCVEDEVCLPAITSCGLPVKKSRIHL